MFGSLILAAALAGPAPATAGPGPMLRLRNATVVLVSPRPAGVSGRIASYADFVVATEAGVRLRMYLLWMSNRQYLPDVGAVCAITYRRERLGGGTLHSPSASGQEDGLANLVYELSCGPPLEWPGQHGPSAL